MWRFIWDEIIGALLVVPALLGMVVLAWYQDPEEPISYRVVLVLVAALLVAGCVAIVMLEVVFAGLD